MKKIITLLVSVTMVASAFAQYGGNDQRNSGYGNSGYGSYDKSKDVVYNDGKFKDNSFFKDFYVMTAREKDMQIAQINTEFDRKIQSVKMRFFMPRFKKEQMIYQLEDQRKDEIRMVLMKFNSPKNRFDRFDHGSKDWNDHDQRKNW